MNNPLTIHEQPPDRMLAGALAHLAQHMESGCRRAAYLSAMLLEQIVSNPTTSDHLRQHTRQLIDILERDPIESAFSNVPAGIHVPPGKSSCIAHKNAL